VFLVFLPGGFFHYRFLPLLRPHTYTIGKTRPKLSPDRETGETAMITDRCAVISVGISPRYQRRLFQKLKFWNNLKVNDVALKNALTVSPEKYDYNAGEAADAPILRCIFEKENGTGLAANRVVTQASLFPAFCPPRGSGVPANLNPGDSRVARGVGRRGALSAFVPGWGGDRGVRRRIRTGVQLWRA
jgi:hypothetical protein